MLPVLNAKCVLRVGLDNSTTFAWSLVSVQKVTLAATSCLSTIKAIITF